MEPKERVPQARSKLNQRASRAACSTLQGRPHEPVMLEMAVNKDSLTWPSLQCGAGFAWGKPPLCNTPLPGQSMRSIQLAQVARP